MSKKLKLDLHTHPVEALKTELGIKGIRDIDSKVAEAVVRSVRSAGIDGIAITEHGNFLHSWVLSLNIYEKFREQNLIILPGEEIDYYGQQFLKIYIPENIRREIPFFKGKEWFLILAHPGYYSQIDLQQFKNVEFDAIEVESIHGVFPIADQLAQSRGIPSIRASDAHTLAEIGIKYIEVEAVSGRRR
ncbi:MAG: PHP domain-containing protein [Dehalococcoidales bacterium]|nr:PHP domain-containing protein [Dehalococcoidales bacterium]